ncbi:MAG: hypothetical protein K5634_06910 [Sphaerochaetaceae bacterium]|nr:hypothetical protein [Sphaerochaetaceae bacterium]
MKITTPPVIQDINMDESLRENQKGSKKRGAVVCGLPRSKELTSFLDSINPDMTNQRLLSMFFSGKLFPSDSLEVTEDFMDDGE